MTKQKYLDAKRAACVRYIAIARADMSAATTTRARQNAERREKRAASTLAAIDAGEFWSPCQERIYTMLYKDYNGDMSGVSAV